MTIHKFSIVLVAMTLFGFPQLVLAADHEQHAQPTAEHDHQAKPEAAHGALLSVDLMALLNQEMALIQKGMMALIPAISAGEWDEVATIGKNIKASFIMKQKLTGAQREELHQVLPPAFIEMDQDFHKSAGMLAHAAEMKNADVVGFYFYKMNAACVSCHSKFAVERFPGLARGNNEDGHHH